MDILEGWRAKRAPKWADMTRQIGQFLSDDAFQKKRETYRPASAHILFGTYYIYRTTTTTAAAAAAAAAAASPSLVVSIYLSNAKAHFPARNRRDRRPSCVTAKKKEKKRKKKKKKRPREMEIGYAPSESSEREL